MLRLIAAGVAVSLLCLAWTFGYGAGRDNQIAQQAEAVQKAVQEAQKKWEEQVDADRAITDAVAQTEVKIREVEKIVYRDIVRWKEPDGCRDLGPEFRRLFNASGRAPEPDTGKTD